MAGYSEKPLAEKLGFHDGLHAAALNTPENYAELLPGVQPVELLNLSGPYDWIQSFYIHAADLQSDFATLKQHLKPSGQLWISWPKKSSGFASELDENVIREIGLNDGLVDVKVAAIDATWSGLKFVFRLKDR